MKRNIFVPPPFHSFVSFDLHTLSHIHCLYKFVHYFILLCHAITPLPSAPLLLSIVRYLFVDRVICVCAYAYVYTNLFIHISFFFFILPFSSDAMHFCLRLHDTPCTQHIRNGISHSKQSKTRTSNCFQFFAIIFDSNRSKCVSNFD